MQLIQRKMLMCHSRILTISITGHQPGKLILMYLAIAKCAVIRCTRSLSPINADYVLNGVILQLQEQHSYLRIL